MRWLWAWLMRRNEYVFADEFMKYEAIGALMRGRVQQWQYLPHTAQEPRRG